MLRHTMIAATAIACVMGCGAGATSAPESPSSNDESAREPLRQKATITLERTACFGTCPIYTVTLHGDGRVDWHGVRFVKTLGRAERRIPPAAVAGLLQEIDRAGFWRWPGRWECGEVITDLPSANITVTTARRKKRIEHYHGDRCVPAAVSALEDRIDRVAGTAAWIGAGR